jgi:hypothetical protein
MAITLAATEMALAMMDAIVATRANQRSIDHLPLELFPGDLRGLAPTGSTGDGTSMPTPLGIVN